jgi:hypothetical protein
MALIDASKIGAYAVQELLKELQTKAIVVKVGSTEIQISVRELPPADAK